MYINVVYIHSDIVYIYWFFKFIYIISYIYSILLFYGCYIYFLHDLLFYVYIYILNISYIYICVCVRVHLYIYILYICFFDRSTLLRSHVLEPKK